ncbi:GcrA family cell cycle regulator [Azospirillum sp. TSA2s]|uniref:GcrA family cell cycle regulator n=1 Tax=Azospirillum sp. TSA2s TaxID=709810 RepID=UPI00145ADCCA|nr:GcrA family cell cycle regulator [Azospirillum sp. TSA2s]
MGALTSSEIETIRWHAAKGVKPGAIAQWYGLKALEVRAIIETAPSGAPAAVESQPRNAGTATATLGGTGHRLNGSDEVPPSREAEEPGLAPQQSVKRAGQSDRPTSIFELPLRAIHRQPAVLFAGVQPEPVDRRTLRRKMIRSDFAVAPAKSCQWIEGNPTPDDSCKCLAPSAPGVSYCPDHAARAYRVLPRGVAAAFPLVSPTP